MMKRFSSASSSLSRLCSRAISRLIRGLNHAISFTFRLECVQGPVKEVFGVWQLGALHKIESEDVVNAVIQFASGATGVIQASTAFWPEASS